MSPEECRAKAAQVRAIVDEQPDFAETAERIAREWERAAVEASRRLPISDTVSVELS
jgi:hypothetical protein